MSLNAEAVRAASSAFRKPPDFHPSYGTAGFRADADLLASTVFRCGLLAAARALLLGAHTGLMITASHNPVVDNGVKMVDPDGGMMPQSFEPVAAELANCANDDDVVAVLRDRVLGAALPALAASASASPQQPQHLTVLVGHDTRPSAPQLLAAALSGVRALGVRAVSCGLVTTPQLHFLVHAANHGSSRAADGPAAPQLQLYYDTLVGAFLQLSQRPHAEDLNGGAGSGAYGSGTAERKAVVLYVDCANGVGAQQLGPLVPALRGVGIELQLRNTGAGGGTLNLGCGADYVQKERMPPSEFGDVPAGARCCSLDGDADRLVYFSPLAAAAGGGGGGVSLLDGDKVSMLAAAYVRDLMGQLPEEALRGIRVCCVQTAYANGASTAYLRDVLQLPAVCTPTGVKFLHEAAHDADVGIYFESNGHGTVLFSQELLKRLRAVDSNAAAKELLLLARVINQTVGDAISGILLVEHILRRKGWGLPEWQALYSDLPSRQVKLKVADRAIITTADAERVCVTPAGLQDAIAHIVQEFPQGRAFARPSGTEDAVRVYAEAATQQAADELARRVAQVVYDLAGGLGSRP